MKKLFLLFSLCLFAFTACKKKDANPKDQEPTYKFTTTKNGENWVNETGGVSLSEDQFVITASKPASENLNEMISIRFNKSDIKSDKYVDEYTAEMIYLLGGDQGVANYRTATKEGKINTLKITEINTTTKIIKGEFNFYLEQHFESPEYEDSIELKNGTFEMTYTEQ